MLNMGVTTGSQFHGCYWSRKNMSSEKIYFIIENPTFSQTDSVKTRSSILSSIFLSPSKPTH